jgi:hypothetical protein
MLSGTRGELVAGRGAPRPLPPFSEAEEDGTINGRDSKAVAAHQTPRTNPRKAKGKGGLAALWAVATGNHLIAYHRLDSDQIIKA